LKDDNDIVPVDILLKLQCFNHLGDVSLLDIGSHAEVRSFSAGNELKADEYHGSNLYLLDGEVELIASDGKVLQRFGVDSERAHEDIFRISTPGLKAVAKNKIEVLVVDAAVAGKYYIAKDVVDNSGIILEDSSNIKIKNDPDLSNADHSSKVSYEISQKFKSEQIDLPSLPDVAVQINKVLQNPNINMKAVANVMHADPVISTRIIQVANSAMFTGQPRTGSLHSAITRIGLKVTRSIVYSVIVHGLYTPKTPLTKKLMERVYEECIRTGVVSHMLCKVIGILEPEQALLAGIVHNIGVIPILIIADKNESLSKDEAELKKVIHDLEHSVGATLLTQWGFSDELVTVAREHNDWFRKGSGEPDYCDIVQAAKLHCKFIGGEKMDTPQLHEVSAFNRLNLGGIDPQDGIQFLKDAQKEITETIQTLLSA
jgi:HD-like signal output (HDOD) protein